jgi:hypothetical protein
MEGVISRNKIKIPKNTIKIFESICFRAEGYPTLSKIPQNVEQMNIEAVVTLLAESGIYLFST